MVYAQKCKLYNVEKDQNIDTNLSMLYELYVGAVGIRNCDGDIISPFESLCKALLQNPLGLSS